MFSVTLSLEGYRCNAMRRYRALVSPLIEMPIGADAVRRAALLDIDVALAGVRCAIGLLPDAHGAVQHALVRIIMGELERAEEGLRRVR